MIELGQLERRHEEFARRKVAVVVVSMEDLADARTTQDAFPHLTVLADAGGGLSEVIGVIHPHAGPSGEDIDAPTTILVDRTGTVRWLYRSGSAVVRLSPDDVLRAVDERLP